MDKDDNNTEKNEEKVNDQTVLPKKKRKFSWTPARKAAFEKCIAARKKQVGTKTETKSEVEKKPELEPTPVKPKVKKPPVVESSSSDSDSDLSEDTSSSRSSTPPRPPRYRRKRKQLQKQFSRMREELAYDMKRHIRKIKRERERPPLLPIEEDIPIEREDSPPRYSGPSYYFV